MLVFDAGTLQLQMANEAATRLLGFSSNELRGRRLDSLIAPADRERLAGVLAQSPAITGMMSARSAWDLSRRDGAIVRFEASTEKVSQDGRPCLVLYQQSIDPTKPTSESAGAAQMPSFSFSALHDLKEPLHIVKGYLNILRDREGAKLDADSRDCLENAYAGTLRLQAIVLNLLEFFRTDAKGIATEPVNLEKSLDDAFAGLRLQMEEAEAVVTRDPLPTVIADRFQISRVLQNVLSNALKFRPAGTPARIHVFARDQPIAWEICVQDAGIGIAADDLERVLEPFQRIHSTDKYPGTGLGLSISRKIMELHGGKLWLESQLGKGTVAHLTLPKGA